MTVRSEESYHLLIQVFCLPVGLGMVAGCETDVNVEVLEEGEPYP